jgi:hypothetical protein
MKKTIAIVLFSLFSISSLAAADIKTAIESLKPMIAAISAASKINFSDAVYLPGYGLNYKGSECGDSKTLWPVIYQQIKGLNAALAQTVKGLDAGDWLSFSVQFVCDRAAGDPSFVARIKGTDNGKPEKWEVWIDGQLVKP